MQAYLKIAGMAAGFAVILITLLLVPSTSWDAVTVVSALSLGASVALIISMPKELVGNNSTQRAVTSSIGTMSLVLIGYVALAVISVLIAFYAENRSIAWIAAIVSIGWAVVGTLICRGSVAYLDSRPRHVNSLNSSGRIDLEALIRIAPDEFKKDIQEVSDLIRFSATAETERSLGYDEDIEEFIRSDLMAAIQSGESAQVKSTVLEVRKRIATREQHLRTEIQQLYKV